MNLMSKPNDQNIERIIYLLENDKSFDAPPDAVRWSKNIFLSRVAAPKKSIVRRMLAVLQIDLSPNRAAFGERSAAGAPTRQMLFEAGENNLDLRIKQSENGLNVRGQILGAGFSGCLIKVFNENAAFETRANELSEFEIAEVPGGIYNLSLRSDQIEVVIENLEL